jgi:hypothetical protein
MNESERTNQSERARPENCEEDVKGNLKLKIEIGDGTERRRVCCVVEN